MFIGKITGTVVATQKTATVVGKKLLLVEAMTVKGSPATLQSSGRVAIAVDTVGAGEGELVIVTQGSSARLTDSTSNVPTDAVVIGIIDAIQAGNTELFKKQN
ncbi:MAG: EutN/CcmL family microcompartment protein [Phycisphaerae bacterium]|nr:EutN/CcmL family microcompartment protein [Phycisphaerae bacterium]